MGLFGSRRVTTVGTTVSRVVEDNALPNAVRTGLLHALFEENQEGIVSNVLAQLANSVGVKAERMYAYAAREYTHGLPTGTNHAAVQGRQEVLDRLALIHGAPVLMEYYQYGAPNSLHIGWMRLISDHAYNPETNEFPALSLEKEKTVYLDDMVVVVPSLDGMNPESLDMWGRPARATTRPGRSYGEHIGSMVQHTPVVEDHRATEEHILVTYCWQDIGWVNEGTDNQYLDNILHKETFTIPIQGVDHASDYFHAKYVVHGVTHYWMYQAGAGTYPELDAVHDVPVTTGTFFPFAYFRYEKKSEIEDKSTDAYRTSKKLVSYLGMDYDMVAEAIDENPDIADVEQAMLTFAVPANTEDQLERRYLYDFFNNWFIASGSQFTTAAASAITIHQMNNPDLSKNSIIIQDRRFKMALHNAGIYKRRLAGSVGPKGTYDSEITETMVEVPFYTVVDDNGTLSEGVRQIPVKVHTYRFQNTDVTYDEIQVVGLKMLYHVFGHYTVTADEDDDILLIPIDRSVTEHYTIPERENLYARGLHFVFNSVVVTRIRWYQTGFFQFLMIVVAVVITIYSMGSDGGSFLAAVAAGSGAAIAAAGWILLKKILVGMIFGYMFQLFVEAVGVEAAFVIAIVAALYGGYQAFKTGSVQGAPWAEELLRVASGLSEGIQSVYQGLMSDLVDEANEFQKYVEEQLKLLDNARETLENNSMLSPYVIFGESPDDFYNRTIHSGNIGVLGFQAVSSYVDSALTLPKLHETLG